MIGACPARAEGRETVNNLPGRYGRLAIDTMDGGLPFIRKAFDGALPCRTRCGFCVAATLCGDFRPFFDLAFAIDVQAV